MSGHLIGNKSQIANEYYIEHQQISTMDSTLALAMYIQRKKGKKQQDRIWLFLAHTIFPLFDIDFVVKNK